jgi:hypothetical protein
VSCDSPVSQPKHVVKSIFSILQQNPDQFSVTFPLSENPADSRSQIVSLDTSEHKTSMAIANEDFARYRAQFCDLESEKTYDYSPLSFYQFEENPSQNRTISSVTTSRYSVQVRAGRKAGSMTGGYKRFVFVKVT